MTTLSVPERRRGGVGPSDEQSMRLRAITAAAAATGGRGAVSSEHNVTSHPLSATRLPHQRRRRDDVPAAAAAAADNDY